MPRFLIMENVPALLSKRHRSNFETWINDLKELGYFSRYFQLNASDFGLPQNRPRLLMLSVFVGKNQYLLKCLEKRFSTITSDSIVESFRKTSYYINGKKETKDLLRIDYTNQSILDEAIDCTPNDTPSRRKIWKENPQIILEDGSFNPSIDVIRTITTKQDRNPNSGKS